MLTPDAISKYASQIVLLYEEYQTRLINDIARRIAKMGLTPTSEWQLSQFQEAGGVFADAMKRIAELNGKSAEEIKTLFYNAGAEAVDYGDSAYVQAGYEPIALAQSPSMLQTLEAGIAKTGGDLRKLTLTAANDAQVAYINATNRAYMDVVNGGFSVQQSVRRAIEEAAEGGIFVHYPSGKRDSIEAAVRRAVITGITQTAAKVTEKNIELLGAEFVETTAHTGARPSHAEWQGRVFHMGGEVNQDGVVYPDFESSTEYGELTGLAGVNCRHGFHPFFPEFSTRAYTDEQLEEMASATVSVDGEEIPVYKATQMQRMMERDIRAAKRAASALEAAGDKEGYNSAVVKLKGLQGKLDDFTKATGLPRQNDREQIAGWSRSQASKASWAARKAAAAAGKAPDTPTPSKSNLSEHDKAILAIEKQSWYNSLKDADAQAIRQVLEKAPDEVLRNWAVNGDKIAGDFYATGKGAYYSPLSQSVTMDIRAIDARDLIRGDPISLTTFFHETGHAFDALAYGDSSLSTVLANGSFRKTLRDDYLNYASGVLGTKVLSVSAINPSQTSRLAREISKESAKKHAVSDIVEGLTAGKVADGYGHGKSYWRGLAVEQETVAHMFAAQTLGGDKEKVMQEYFPNAYKMFLNTKSILSGEGG